MANGREYDLAGKSQTSLRAHASWFTDTVDASLVITNRGSSPLVVRPNDTRMSDREGPLPRYFYGDEVVGCDNHTDSIVTLAPGEACASHLRLQVVPDRERLRTLTLVQDGVARGGVAVPISVTFELDN